MVPKPELSWGWNLEFDLAKMTSEMLEGLKGK